MKKLTELLQGLQYELISGSLDREVESVVNDSRKLEEGCLFLCIVGAQFDGHAYAAEAAEKGAAVLVVQKKVELPEGSTTTVIRVEDTRYAMAFISAAWFDHPAQKLKTIGITGTKGKTTTTYLVRSMLEKSGRKVGLIGTIEVIIGEEHIPANNTTPESYLLQSYFAQMVEAGCDTVVMEVSSQALMLHRSQGFLFDYGIFTNLEPDHIGPNEHKDMDDYIRCKGLLMRQCKVGIANRDADYFDQVMDGHTCELITYGRGEGCDFRATDINLLSDPGKLSVRFRTEGLIDMEVEIPTPGLFSVYNAMTAMAICHQFGIDIDTMKRALADTHVRGRIEPVKVSDDFIIMVDYAHNAMALESLLSTLKDYHPTRLVCVFGCGGNRSKLRRFDMGEVSGKLADLTIITSDNPRFEEPEDIIADIITGIEKTDGKYLAIIDRKEAIRYAIEHAEKGDVIIVAGKGHEDYQEIRGVKHHMDDREMILEVAGLS